jgi:triphosphoribosyl-dephospho-CoA synthase
MTGLVENGARDLSAKIAAAFVTACRDELDAPKPGNVHFFSAGHGMSAEQFILSAQAAAGPLTRPGAKVGQRILGATQATSAAVEINTNLGIILLCAPLAAAAEQPGSDLRAALARLLQALDRDDAALAFRAIALASPGGLGRVDRHDVRAPATVSLREAMAAAADRDRIAYQYGSAFKDVFGIGQRALTAARARALDHKWVTLAVFLRFLAAFPDSHIVRRHGAATAEEVRRAAEDFRSRLESAADPAHLLADLLAWDKLLKQNSINPGTSADLTVAALFVAHLHNILPSAGNNG